MTKMVRWSTWILLLLEMFGVGLAHAENPPSAVSLAVVEIYAFQKDGSLLAGSGFFISTSGEIATAYHVVQGARKVLVVFRGGSFNDPTIKSFDEHKDLAILKLPLPPGKTTTFLNAIRPPDGLLSKSGVAVGNPDQKSGFFAKVSFPRDKVMLAQEWTSSIAGNAQAVFKSRDLHIVAVDGTINPGMSGGPIVVDNVAIGVISGAEQRRGAGFGWAISSEYISGLKPAPANMTFAALPPLDLLASGLESIAPLKAAETSQGSEMYGNVIEFREHKRKLEVLPDETANVGKLLTACEPPLRTVAVKGLTPDQKVCLQEVVYASFLARYVKVPGTDAIAAADRIIRTVTKLLDIRARLFSEEEIKQGLIKKMTAMGRLCQDPLSSQLQSQIEQQQDALNVGRTILPELDRFNTWPMEFSEDTYSAVLTSVVNHADGLRQMEHQMELAANMAKLYSTQLSGLDACINAASAFVDFHVDKTRISEHVDVSALLPIEKATYASFFEGVYQATIRSAERCQALIPAEATQFANAEVQWKMDNAETAKRAREFKPDGVLDKALLERIPTFVDSLSRIAGPEKACAGVLISLNGKFETDHRASYEALTGRMIPYEEPSLQSSLKATIREFVSALAMQAMVKNRKELLSEESEEVIKKLSEAFPVIIASQTVSSFVDKCSLINERSSHDLGLKFLAWQKANGRTLQEKRAVIDGVLDRAGLSGEEKQVYWGKLQAFIEDEDTATRKALQVDAPAMQQGCMRLQTALSSAEWKLDALSQGSWALPN